MDLRLSNAGRKIRIILKKHFFYFCRGTDSRWIPVSLVSPQLWNLHKKNIRQKYDDEKLLLRSEKSRDTSHRINHFISGNIFRIPIKIETSEKTACLHYGILSPRNHTFGETSRRDSFFRSTSNYRRFWWWFVKTSGWSNRERWWDANVSFIFGGYSLILCWFLLQGNIRLLQISDLENVLTRKFYFESENEKHTTIWKELEDDDV